MWPATYHQKFVVADGATAIIGGLDIDARRYDTPDHDRPAGQTWHDVSLEVTGDVAADARDHFNSCWNFEVPRFNARLTRMGAPAPELAAPVRPEVVPPRTRQDKIVEKPALRLLRTRSTRSRSWLSIGPRAHITEIETAHLEQIREARDCLYLESQFLRSRHLADALVAAGRARPGLHLIVLLPAATDEVVFDGERGMAVRHGEWLQVRAIDRIRAAYAERCGFFCLTRGTQGTETGERDAVEGQEIAYVHAKVAIADGETALVSSANLNGRSLRWDREAGVFWENAAGVAEFQRTLWQQHLRREHRQDLTVTGASALQMWQAAASKGPEGQGSAQVVAYPLEKARKFARCRPFVPHDMV
jgi:phosphatidylserine/phosphatidylglycerophosphate/cardiolipin synthase-like enzyme